jgi:hypothetical protein
MITCAPGRAPAATRRRNNHASCEAANVRTVPYRRLRSTLALSERLLVVAAARAARLERAAARATHARRAALQRQRDAPQRARSDDDEPDVRQKDRPASAACTVHRCRLSVRIFLLKICPARLLGAGSRGGSPGLRRAPQRRSARCASREVPSARVGQLSYRREIPYIGVWRPPTRDSAHEVGAILKPRRKTRSAQLAERGTDMMVADATSKMVKLASSEGRRFARSRRRRCRYAHFHHVMLRHLVKYSSARV